MEEGNARGGAEFRLVSLALPPGDFTAGTNHFPAKRFTDLSFNFATMASRFLGRQHARAFHYHIHKTFEIRDHRPAERVQETGQRERQGEREREKEKEGAKQPSRFLCAGKRPSVLLWFQLLSPSVNRVISHGPSVYPRYSFLLYLGPCPSSPPAPFLFHLRGSLLPTRHGMSSTMRPVFFEDVLTQLANVQGGWCSTDAD